MVQARKWGREKERLGEGGRESEAEKSFFQVRNMRGREKEREKKVFWSKTSSYQSNKIHRWRRFFRLHVFIVLLDVMICVCSPDRWNIQLFFLKTVVGYHSQGEKTSRSYEQEYSDRSLFRKGVQVPWCWKMQPGCSYPIIHSSLFHQQSIIIARDTPCEQFS